MKMRQINEILFGKGDFCFRKKGGNKMKYSSILLTIIVLFINNLYSHCKKEIIFTILFCVIFFSAAFSQEGPYLGQDPPGLSPGLFAPENLRATSQWQWHSSPVFSPDGNEMLFVKYYHADGKIELNYMQMVDNIWTEPTLPIFADSSYSENCPVFSPSGDTLYFRSTRPGGSIFMTIKIENGWSNPIAVPIPFPEDSFIGWQFAVIKNKSIYFEIWEGNEYNNVDIYFASYLNGDYQTPEILPNNINTEYFEWGPYVDEEDNFILFSSNREEGLGFNDIYISTKDVNEIWSDPINLGPEINSSWEDVYPTLTFDSKYFFFGNQKSGDLGNNPYWVDAQVIYDLITDVKEIANSEVIPNHFELNQNYPNPFNTVTTIRYGLPEQSQILINIYDILGREIRKLVSTTQDAGYKSVIWDGTDEFGRSVGTGIYLYQIKARQPSLPAPSGRQAGGVGQAGDFGQTKKMLLLR